MIAIIPARGNSKRLKDKNLRKIDGKSLLAHTIEDAKEATSNVWVSSNDKNILQEAEKHGAGWIKRPKLLALDTAPSETAIIHALNVLSVPEDEIVIFLQCTSPFRKPGEVRRAARKFQGYGRGYYSREKEYWNVSMFSCYTLYPFVWDEENRLQYEIKERPRRQEKKPLYVEDGSFYISWAWVYYSTGNRLRKEVAKWKHDKIYGLEIDTMEDLELARALYPWLKRQGKV